MRSTCLLSLKKNPFSDSSTVGQQAACFYRIDAEFAEECVDISAYLRGENQSSSSWVINQEPNIRSADKESREQEDDDHIDETRLSEHLAERGALVEERVWHSLL